MNRLPRRRAPGEPINLPSEADFGDENIFLPRMDLDEPEGKSAISDLSELPGTFIVGKRRDGGQGRIGRGIADVVVAAVALEGATVSRD